MTPAARRRPRRLLLAGLLLLAAGCPARGPEAPSGDAFRRGGDAFLAGRPDEAARHFALAAARADSAGLRLRARHWEGMSLLETGRTAEARERFDAVLAARAGPDLVAAALLAKARSLALERRTDAAAALYERLLREHPDRIDAAAARAALRGLRGGAAAGETLHTVQAGAFRSRDRARALRRALLLAGFDSFLDERATDGGALHVVQTGAFSSRRAAEAHAGRLRARGFDAAVR